MENKKDTEKVIEKTQKPNKRKTMITITAILIAVISFFSGFLVNYLINGNKLNRVNTILRIMESVGFVFDENGEKREITEEEYADALVNTILDDYSRYFTATEYAEYVNSSMGNSSGIGISFYNTDSVIDKVTFNSPADKAGVERGDAVQSFEIDGTVKPVKDYYDIKNCLDGVSSDTEIKMNVLRGEKELSFTLNKTAYRVSYVTYYDNEIKYCFESENNESLTAKTYNGKGNSLLLIPTIIAPVLFMSAFTGWLYWYGHNMQEWGAFKIKPFMPTALGDGKVAQFTTHSYPTIGFWVMIIMSALSILAIFSKNKYLKENA
jgi:flagellar basal body-associated protein FliL